MPTFKCPLCLIEHELPVLRPLGDYAREQVVKAGGKGNYFFVCPARGAPVAVEVKVAELVS